jgi:hypothetical protein
MEIGLRKVRCRSKVRRTKELSYTVDTRLAVLPTVLNIRFLPLQCPLANSLGQIMHWTELVSNGT